MQTFDNSREGNDCYIHEYWLWCEGLRTAIRVIKVDGWSDNGIETTSFSDVVDIDEMPRKVQQWFQGESE
jgi:hypothetical protein